MNLGLTPKPRYLVAHVRGEAFIVGAKTPHSPQFCHATPLLDTSNCISCRNI
jgi:hypothetical protein